MTPVRGKVWLFDLGMAEKVRPALVVSVAYGDADRALVTLFHTQPAFAAPNTRCGSRSGSSSRVHSYVQNVATYPDVRAIRKLGKLEAEQFNLVFAALLRWLGHAGG